LRGGPAARTDDERDTKNRRNTDRNTERDDDETTSGGDRDCDDFDTQEEAQAFFEDEGWPGSDPHRLDAEEDSIACETLP
jgi:micrococcal nuclease